MPAQRRHLPISLPRQRLAAGLGACLALLIVALLWWRPWVAAGCPPDSGAELLGDASDPATTAGPIRIMPLGDSLTDGFDVPGGYRIELWSLLAGDGLCVDFVGSLTNGPRTMPDRDHEGHSGWRIDQIAGSAGPWLERHRPQIVLLLVGTNDVVQDFALAAAPGRLGALIDQITGALPESRVVVASIPRVGDPVVLGRVQAYNAALAAVAASKGPRVSYADAFSAIDEADLDPDGIHLTASGYGKLARVWHAAIRALVTR